MADKSIKNLLKMVQRGAAASRFNVQSIPYHVHNGVDAPQVFSPTLTYVGRVPYDLTEPGLEYILPVGWTIINHGGNYYEVVHNLDTFSYVVVVTPYQSLNNYSVGVVGQFKNSFGVQWNSSTSWNFHLTQIDNKRTSSPLYDVDIVVQT
jgi:hypothetical protein